MPQVQENYWYHGLFASRTSVLYPKDYDATSNSVLVNVWESNLDVLWRQRSSFKNLSYCCGYFLPCIINSILSLGCIERSLRSNAQLAKKVYLLLNVLCEWTAVEVIRSTFLVVLDDYGFGRSSLSSDVFRLVLTSVAYFNCLVEYTDKINFCE